VTGNGIRGRHEAGPRLRRRHAAEQRLAVHGGRRVALHGGRQHDLLGHADNLLARSGRPVEVFKVSGAADAAREVQPGDYCRVITKGDPWLGDMDRTMRVKQVSGDLSDVLTLEMFPLAALL
jgi:hypothetical protein